MLLLLDTLHNVSKVSRILSEQWCVTKISTFSRRPQCHMRSRTTRNEVFVVLPLMIAKLCRQVVAVHVQHHAHIYRQSSLKTFALISVHCSCIVSFLSFDLSVSEDVSPKLLSRTLRSFPLQCSIAPSTCLALVCTELLTWLRRSELAHPDINKHHRPKFFTITPLHTPSPHPRLAKHVTRQVQLRGAAKHQ